MRMTGESEQDKNYRIALENMRYKACTPADIRFLNTLISTNIIGRPSAKSEPWRSAPIIVGENKYKDEINRLGTLRFASETKQKLVRFYCDDTIATSPTAKASAKVPSTKKSSINGISEELQKILWELPTSSYDLNCPGVLDICLGLPVIIRHNFATELSITKGQKGTVYAWHITQGNFGQQVLETIFVLLDNPPTEVQIDHLPVNVVPISRRKTTGYIALPDDTKICITRNQVDILPGFAMTAHASQGQSLHSNAIDLNTLTDHHAWYTALSRSRSANRTLILQGFDSSKITGGASGALRREYRELELLDEITSLRFLMKLPSSVCGSTRKLLIETFLQWKGSQYLPKHIHPSIKWSTHDPYIIEQEPLPAWTTMDKKKFKSLKEGMTQNTITAAPKEDAKKSDSFVKSNKRVIDHLEVVSIPLTTSWSSNSCAFDAVLPILYQGWIELDSVSYDCYSNFTAVVEDFVKVKSNMLSFNDARDTYRRSLALRKPRSFTFGAYCAVTEVLEDILHTNLPFIKCTLWCELNHNPRRQPLSIKHCNIPEIRDVLPSSTSKWLHDNSPAIWHNVCHICKGTLIKEYKFQFGAPFIVFPCDNTPEMVIDEKVVMHLREREHVYNLRGVIYYSSIRQHFISRIISSQGFVYQHDGMTNGGEPALESSSLHNIDLSVCHGARLTSAIYNLSS
ncbi:hypothetical protein F5878DRAFT_546597 [Lentinula raphanica]|uniref:Helitron helicase-like domain-containing protein n=1 Tax=Lentinula raphanica TaxID=153919 RepID=A0AA38NZA6_9AGAR|nr:hypothetical protein F5878DRAFT_546597 [Lentinula raphanica]